MIRKPLLGRAEMASVGTVAAWFDRALERDDPKPSPELYDHLARSLQIAVNRANNTQLELLEGQHLPILDRKDVSPAEEQARYVNEFKVAADNLLFHLERFRDEVPGHEWHRHGHTVTIDDLENVLTTVGANARATPIVTVQNGRTHVPWHAVGRAIAPEVQAILRQSRVRNLSMKNNTSPTTSICADALEWSYRITLQPSSFATAMRKRDRSKKSKVD